MAINLTQYIPQLIEACMTSLEGGAGTLVGAAKSKAPKKTGELQAGIGKKKVDLTIITVNATPKQSVFQELGTKHHKPQPFMRPAFDNNAIKIADKAEKDVLRVVKAINSGKIR